MENLGKVTLLSKVGVVKLSFFYVNFFFVANSSCPLNSCGILVVPKYISTEPLELFCAACATKHFWASGVLNMEKKKKSQMESNL